MRAREFVGVWECKEHIEPGGCWSSSHLTLADVKEDAARCAASCRCWRHRVIEFMEPSE